MKIYVGNLDYSITEDDLKKIFEEFGPVESSIIIKDKFTGKNRGFGFIEMEEEAGHNAINSLNNKEINGRSIKVNEAKPRENNNRNQNRGGGYRRNF